ncbi:MAG: flippase [Candidatus Spechtbacterales bacterium]
MASLTRKIASNTLVSYAGRVVSSVFALLTIGLMTRSLGQEGFGQYTIVIAYVSLFVILSDLGLQVLMTREISRAAKGFDEIASNFFSLRLISSLLFLFAGFGAAFAFPYPTEIKIGIGIGALGFFFLSINQLLLGIFQKHLAMHMAAAAEIAGRGGQFLFVYLIYAYAGGFGSSALLFLLLIAMSAASFIMFFLHFLFARRYVRVGLRFDFSYWREILKTAWPIALSIVLTLIYFKIDAIFLSLMKPAADVGIYGAAYRVLEGLIFFPAMFAGIMMPILARDAVSSMKQFKKTFTKSMRVITVFAVPLTAGGILLSYSIANLIGGKEFLISGAPLQPLFIATGLIFFGNLLGRAVVALDLQKKAMFAYLFGVVLNVVLNLIFIPKYSYMGAAWTTVVTEFLVVVFLFYFVYKKTGAVLNITEFVKAAFAAAVMYVALYFFVSPITTPLSFLGLGLAMLAGAGAYFGVLCLVGGIGREEILAIVKK